MRRISRKPNYSLNGLFTLTKIETQKYTEKSTMDVGGEQQYISLVVNGLEAYYFSKQRLRN